MVSQQISHKHGQVNKIFSSERIDVPINGIANLLKGRRIKKSRRTKNIICPVLLKQIIYGGRLGKVPRETIIKGFVRFWSRGGETETENDYDKMKKEMIGHVRRTTSESWQTFIKTLQDVRQIVLHYYNSLQIIHISVLTTSFSASLLLFRQPTSFRKIFSQTSPSTRSNYEIRCVPGNVSR